MNAILKLSRWHEFIPFTLPLTLVGGLLAARFDDSVQLDERLLYVLIANFLAMSYAFMINDIEDSEDDKLNPERGAKNAVSAGEISKSAAWAAALAAAVIALALYALAGHGALISGLLILMISHFYSWKPVRLKALPVVDILSHVMMLSTLLMLAAYFIYADTPGKAWPMIISVTLFSAYGQLYNQIRDYEEDRAAGLKNTASFLGKRLTMALSYLAFATALACIFIAIFNGTFPLGLMGVVVVSIPLLLWMGKGRDFRGSQTSDLLASLQVQLLAVANLILICWLAYVILSAYD
ncbi:MAG: UbiA family prenyltransferase [Anaerolineae bacterium]|nr:UbiA family prenyltransferase [Anaerolineae bacterium]